LREDGEVPIIEWPPEGEKRRAASASPISLELYQKSQQLANTHPSPLLIPLAGIVGRGMQITRIIEGLRHRAEISKRLSPHSFRHFLALTLRRKGVKTDTAINALGWKNGRMWDDRYGKRGAFETLDEVREALGMKAAENPANTVDLRQYLRK
jgi:integrase